MHVNFDPESKNSLLQTLKILRAHWRKILLTSVVCAASLVGWRLLQPLKYVGDGVFREKSSNTNSGTSSSIALTLVSGMNGDGKSEGKVLMCSPVVLERVIEELHLQAVIREETLLQRLARRVCDNLSVEYNYLMKLRKKAPANPPTPLRTSSLRFQGEYPLEFTMHFISEEVFELNYLDGEHAGTGQLGKPFETPEYGFTIEREDKGELTGKTYNFKLLPMQAAIADLRKRLELHSEKGAPLLIRVTYFDQRGATAANVVNAIMRVYQNMLKLEQQRTTHEQIHYLHERQAEMNHDLTALLQDYAQTLETDLASFGYAETETAIKFFSDQFQELNKRTQRIDLGLQQLEAVLDAPSDNLADVYLGVANAPRFMMELIDSLISLRRESHMIGLFSLEEETSGEIQQVMQRQMERLGEVESSREMLLALMTGVDQEVSELKAEPFSENPQYALKEWLEQWRTILTESSAKEEKDSFKRQFLSYLQNLDRRLETQEKMIREALSYQHSNPEMYAEIDLAGSEALLEAYRKQLAEVEYQIVQSGFLVEKINDPHVELYALASLIQDPGIQQSIHQSHELTFQLKDERNRGVKERERIQKELALKRHFLAGQMEKMHELGKLHRLQLRNSMQQLQKKRFLLLQEKIALLENQFKEAVKTHIRNQKEEKYVLQEQAEKLRSELVLLPQRWIAEKTVRERLGIHTSMLEEVAKLVELKNINNNLETIKSAALVPAMRMTHPKRPDLFLYLFAGLILGAIASISACIGLRILKTSHE